MSITERLKNITRLGKKYNLEGDLKTAIEINSLSLDNLQEFKSLVQMPAFRFFIDQMKKDLKSKQDKLNELTLDPCENKFKICFYRASFELLKNQIDFFKNVLNKEQNLIDEQERLQEAVNNDNL